MRFIQQASLWFSEGASDKVYEVDLCEMAAGQFVVNFRYGRRGMALREGTKTTLPVSEAQARKIYDQLVGSKTRVGYQEAGVPAPTVVAPSPAVGATAPTDRAAYLLGLLRSSLPSGTLPETTKWPLSRLIWRVGELRLREAVPALLALLPKSADLQKYCLAWALGRCGDAAAIPALGKLYAAPASSEKVKRITLVSWLALAKDDARQSVVARLHHQLPPELRAVLTTGNEASLREFLSGEAGQPIARAHVETLYLLSEDHPPAHAVVVEWLTAVPFAPGTFRPVRHLFKVAEFREDARVFGLLAYRFEKTPEAFRYSSYGDYAIVDGNWLQQPRRELAKRDSRLAYSDKTRTYLRGRTWRTLRTLGQDGQAAYTDLATGVLLSFSDEADRTEPQQRQYETYDWTTRETHLRLTSYDSYASYGIFNHLLYQNSPRYEIKPNTRVWRCRADYQPGGPAPDQREEAFPELWDRFPEQLVKLLLESRAERVHEFAAKALRDNPRWPELINLPVLMRLIGQPYAGTVRLGLTLAPHFYDPARPNLPLVRLLVRHPLREARDLARPWVQAGAEYFLRETLLFADLIFNPYADVREWSRALLAQHPLVGESAQLLLARIVAELLALRADDTAADVVEEGARTLLAHFGEPLRNVGLAVVRDLLQHPASAVQQFGADLLLRHRVAARDLPNGLIESLIGSPTPGVRAVGVQLFGQLPAEVLLSSAETLLAFCVSPFAEVRGAVRPIVGRLSADHPDFGRQLLRQLVPFVQRKEPFEGLKEDLIGLMEAELADFLSGVDQDTSLQLLHSRQTPNQKLGNRLLRGIRDEDLALRQVVRLAGHEMLAVRQRARQFYETNPARLRAEPAEALRILDVDWEDTRRFAFGFFRQHFGADDWTPALLVSVCDSTREDVQQFGRELITRFFREENGQDYLLRLSQHPSPGLQLFATHYLEQFASDQPANTAALEPYFTTVLSQVNRAGVAKSRIFAFLRQEALKDESTAQLVARLMARQSVTMAVADKAACLQTMRDIRKAYPLLDLPLTLKPVLFYAKK